MDQLDLLIVGSGVAGLSAALRAVKAAPGMRVGVVSKGELSDSATQWAQGGVAAVLHATEADAEGHDTFDLHALDTLRAGAGMCDQAAVKVLVSEGPTRVRELARLGAEFDRNQAGKWLLSREGGHSAARVVHAGGAATGAEVERALVEAARLSAARIEEHCQAVDLIVEHGRCRGVVVAGRSGRRTELRAAHTLLASGGAGHLYPVTTNPVQATGDGLAMAARAGAAVADLEFVQFHPTALFVASGDGPRPLLSEALRGEGALLRDAKGHRFVDELQPRDVVAIAIFDQMRQTDVSHVWLDVGPIDAFSARFPSLARTARAFGLDPDHDWLPVSPAAHYMCGGVVTDLDGSTTIPGLWAAGEVACSGVHGANRLASNSLLEGMVFAARAVEAMIGGRDVPVATGVMAGVLDPGREGPDGVSASVVPVGVLPSRRTDPQPADQDKVREALQRAMFDGAGLVRSAGSLAQATSEVDRLAGLGLPGGEAANLLDVAALVLAGATARTESRGGHRRSDYPDRDPSMSHRFVQW